MNFILADNQDITRMGMKYIIRLSLQKEEYGEMKTLHSRLKLIQALEENDDAIVVLDFTLFDIGSQDDLLNLSSRFPNVHWIMFSETLTTPMIKRLSIEKQFSILLKDCNMHEIQYAVNCALKGERYLCQQVTNILLSTTANDANEKLTPSEIEILKLVAEGLSVKEIANKRFSSTHTITTHKKNIFRKLNVNTAYEATKYALRMGLVDMAEYNI